MWEKINFEIAFWSNWFEVIGFAITSFMAFKLFFLNDEIKRLNSRHLFAVRVDEHLTEFKKTSRKIANQLGDFPQNSKEIRLEISKCLGNCLSLKKKVENSELSTLKQLTNNSKKIIANKHDSFLTLKFYDKILGRKPLRESDIDEYYEILTLLITEIEHLDKDIKKTIK
jgi:hypothetical protein